MFAGIQEKFMNAVQLDFFESYDETAQIKIELYKLRQSQDNLRRGLFARHGDLVKHTLSLYDEIDKLKFEIAKLKHEVKGGPRGS